MKGGPSLRGGPGRNGATLRCPGPAQLPLLWFWVFSALSVAGAALQNQPPR